LSIRDDDESTTGSGSANRIDPYATRNRRRRGVRVSYAAVVALGLAIGGGAIAGAATGSSTSITQASDQPEGSGEHGGFGGTPPAAVGTVASVSTNAFILTRPDGTKVPVDVSSSTSYSEFGRTSDSIRDVTVGAHFAVFGTDANNTVTATRVDIADAAGTDGPGGPDDSHGPDRAGVWAPSSSSGAVPSGSSTTSTGSSSGSTLA